MLVRLLVIALALLFSTSAEARHHHRHGHTHYHQHHGHGHTHYHNPGHHLVTVPTAAGQGITVAKHLAQRFQNLIADLVAAGYKPKRISCFSLTGHVAHSRHHVGAACDFDGSLSRNAFMRSPTANRIIVKNRFRNGCSFKVNGITDCGHVDDGVIGRRYRRAY